MILFQSDKLEVAYDVFVTYEASDKNLAAMVTKKLKSKNKDLSIYTELLKFEENIIWQDDVSKIMASSNR
jgi:16S rRNA C1402 (ribose-2'-O) methylase RsmI